MIPFEREELLALKLRAYNQLAGVESPEWKMAYEQFIFACSTLDAFIARSTAYEPPPVPCDHRGPNYPVTATTNNL